MTVPFRLFNESESVKFAGISLDTLRQYERYGLLQSVKKDSETFYKECDLRTLFSVTGSGFRNDEIPTFNSDADRPQSETPSGDTDLTSTTPPSETSTQSSPVIEVSASDHIEAVVTNGASHEKLTSTTASKPIETEAPRTNATTQNSDTAHSTTRTPPRFAEVSMSAPGSTGAYEMLELNRSLRDQITILKEERDWLRKRVEKLETRGERDQMLLIAENETVKTVLAKEPPKRRSFWALALPWLKEN